MWETFIPTPCWCGKYGCAPVNGNFFNKKKPIEIDEISVLIETGNQFSIHQTRLSEASPNGLSFPPKKHKLHPVKASKSSTKKCYYVPCPSLQTNKKNATKSTPIQQSFWIFVSAPSHGGALIFFGVGMAWAFTVVSSAKAAAIAAPTPKSGSSGTKDSAVGSSGTKEPKPGKASKIETSATAWVCCSKWGFGGDFFLFLWAFFQVINRLISVRSFFDVKFYPGILDGWIVASLTRSLSICSCLCCIDQAMSGRDDSHLYAVGLPFDKIPISKMQVERQKHSTRHIYVIPSYQNPFTHGIWTCKTWFSTKNH